MTKAQRIIDLAAQHPDWSTRELGIACNCRPEYVRVVLRQRVGGSRSKADRQYCEANKTAIAAAKLSWQRANRERVAAHSRAHYWRKKAEARA
jgi:hypothetical protein